MELAEKAITNSLNWIKGEITKVVNWASEQLSKIGVNTGSISNNEKLSELKTKVQAQVQAKSAGNYSNGGVIPGNSYSGDRLQANVNSGEMLLNRSQQANLFDIVNGGMSGNANNIQLFIETLNVPDESFVDQIANALMEKIQKTA
jgi:hypothetical protein